MKHERMTFLVCSAAVVLASVISFSAAMCLIEAYELNCQPQVLIVACCVVSGIAVAAMSIRRSWIVGLGALAVYLALIVWKFAVLRGEVWTFLYHVTYKFSLCFDNVIVLGTPGGDVRWLIALLVMPLAWLCVWTVCRQAGALLVALACAPVFVMSLIIVDVAPELWLTLLTGALVLLIMSSSVRAHSAAEGGRLVWWLALPVAAVMVILTMMSPPQTYVRSSWSEELKTFAEQGLDLEILPGKQPVSLSGWNDVEDVDLSAVGPRRKNTAYALRYYADAQVRYLRGASFGVYANNTWSGTERAAYALLGLERSPLLCAKENAATVKIETARRQNVLFTPYYLYSLPQEGVAMDDSYIENEENVTTYEMEFSPSDGERFDPDPAYDDYVIETYTQLPPELEAPLLAILEESHLTGQTAEVIAQYVKESGVYDLNVSAVPEGEDFALYFLRHTHRGYCVHFATSAVLLMRAAGIPARYVTGYSVRGQVGQWNDVTEEAAHAWVEYYWQGEGWFSLDPTPSDPSQPPAVEQEPAPTPETEEQDPAPSQPPEETPEREEQQQITAAPDTRAGSGWYWWLLAIPAVAALVFLRRWVILFCRKNSFMRGHPNRRLLIIWRWLVRLYKAADAQMPEQWICLAEKAKFSQHTITTAELRAVLDEAQRQVAQLKQQSLLHRLWFRFGSVLY